MEYQNIINLVCLLFAGVAVILHITVQRRIKDECLRSKQEVIDIKDSIRYKEMVAIADKSGCYGSFTNSKGELREYVPLSMEVNGFEESVREHFLGNVESIKTHKTKKCIWVEIVLVYRFGFDIPEQFRTEYYITNVINGYDTLFKNIKRSKPVETCRTTID